MDILIRNSLGFLVFIITSSPNIAVLAIILGENGTGNTKSRHKKSGIHNRSLETGTIPGQTIKKTGKICFLSFSTSVRHFRYCIPSLYSVIRHRPAISFHFHFFFRYFVFPSPHPLSSPLFSGCLSRFSGVTENTCPHPRLQWRVCKNICFPIETQTSFIERPIPARKPVRISSGLTQGMCLTDL